MAFKTPWQPDPISATLSIEFDNANVNTPDMYVYTEDPTVSRVDPRTAIIR